ncbi:MAG: hypothetical protein P4L22_01100 [Candidatus Babeliales bacterium]|nr:hypothetical protein [Candidatus Babeliales bacterium]
MTKKSILSAFGIILNFIFLINCDNNNVSKLFQLNKNIISSTEPKFKISRIGIQNDNLILCGTNLNKLQLLKYDPNTKLKEEFGINGKVISGSFETAKLKIDNILIDPKDNSIIVCGISYNLNNKTKVIIYKFDEYGNLLFLSFIPIDNLIRTFDLKFTETGELTCGLACSNTFSIINLTLEGLLNKKFGKDGIKSFEISKKVLNIISTVSMEKLKLAIQNNENIIIGYSIKNKFTLIRLTEEGNIDKSFNKTGARDGILNDITTLNNNKIILCTTSVEKKKIFITKLRDNAEIAIRFNPFVLPKIYLNQNVNLQIQPNNSFTIFSNLRDKYIITSYKNL